jgi:hypothetical protein
MVQRAECLVERGLRIEAVHLPQVDVLHAEPGQRPVQPAQQVPA